MDEFQIEKLVKEVLNRINKRVLLVLTNADGYQCEITNRLKQYRHISFSILITNNAQQLHTASKWQTLGEVVTCDVDLFTASLEKFDCIFVPFLEFETMGEIANGLFHSDAAKIINYALMKDKKVLAFDYNCNPESELNQIIGLCKNTQWNKKLAINYKSLIDCGVLFCSMNALEEKIMCRQALPAPINKLKHEYITLKDVLESGKEHFSNSQKLTDLALEHLRSTMKLEKH